MTVHIKILVAFFFTILFNLFHIHKIFFLQNKKYGFADKTNVFATNETEYIFGHFFQFLRLTVHFNILVHHSQNICFSFLLKGGEMVKHGLQ